MPITLKSNYSYAQYLFKLLIHGRTLSLDRIEFKFIWAFFFHAMFTKDLNLVLFNTIYHQSSFKIPFCWNFISNFISTNLQHRDFIVRFENCGINCFHLGGVKYTLNAPWKLNQRKANNTKCLRVLIFLITCRIDLKKIEEKKNEMKWEMVHRSKVTDQGYQWYKRHWMSLTFSTLLVVLKKLKQWEITWQNSDAKMQDLI